MRRRLGRAVPPTNRLPPYSSKLPWGSTGIGFNDASVIAYHALTCHLAGGSYKQMRQAMLDAAKAEFGSDSPQHRAVQNAYAAINVGARASGTPASIATIASVEPANGSDVTAQGLNGDFGSPPSGASAGAPDKVRVVGAGNSVTWFTAGGPGQYIAVSVRSNDPYTGYKLEMFDGFGAPTATAKQWFTSSIVTDSIDDWSGVRYLKVTRVFGSGSYTLEVEVQ